MYDNKTIAWCETVVFPVRQHLNGDDAVFRWVINICVYIHICICPLTSEYGSMCAFVCAFFYNLCRLLVANNLYWFGEAIQFLYSVLHSSHANYQRFCCTRSVVVIQRSLGGLMRSINPYFLGCYWNSLCYMPISTSEAFLRKQIDPSIVTTKKKQERGNRNTQFNSKYKMRNMQYDIKNNAWVTVNNDFWVTSEAICQ